MRMAISVGVMTVVGLAVNAGLRAEQIEWGIADGGNGHFYEVVLDDGATWSEAQDDAIVLGGHLATFTSEEEQAFVESLLVDQGAPTGGYWMGLQRPELELEGSYEWVTEEPLDYMHWWTGEPNGVGSASGEKGQIQWSESEGDPWYFRRGYWNDIYETGLPTPTDPGLEDLNRAGYIVEIELFIPTFIRGDANHDGFLTLPDAIVTLGVLFGGEPTTCPIVLDANDDGQLGLVDPIVVLMFLFGNGAAPLPPFPECGADTEGANATLACDGYTACDEEQEGP